MRNFFIFHGSYGHPGENWYPWLKQELESMGHRVFIPTFPIPKVKGEGHKLDLWFKAFEAYKQYVNKDTIVIAHSRGCTFTYHLLPLLNIKIHGLYLVGQFIDYDQWRPEVYAEHDSFQAKPYLWKKIRKMSEYIEVFQSTNDVIPVCEGEFVAHWLHAKLTIVKNAGHFNMATYKRFVTFPLLLEKIKNRL